MSEADEQYDSHLHPDPIVDPMECSGHLVVTVRGTGEPPKGQLLGPVAREIAKARPLEVETVDLDYPADTDVNEGATFGVRLLVDTLNVQAEQCPEQTFVLLGYSQGALIVGDALSSPDLRLVGQTVGELSEPAADRIRAIVLFGNPRFIAGKPYDAGNYSESLGGILPREPGSLTEFADRMRDYCVAGDFICQSSLDLDEEGHVQYFENGMQQVAAQFVIARLAPATANPSPDPTPAEESGRTAASSADAHAQAGV